MATGTAEWLSAKAGARTVAPGSRPILSRTESAVLSI